MNKEPIGLYIFRFVLGFGLFAFMCMLYWSSVLLEQDVKNLQSSVSEIKDALFRLRQDQMNNRARNLHEVDQVKSDLQSESHNPLKRLAQSERAQMDPSLPNLLTEDMFYAKTLPKMLGPNFRPSGTRHMATVGKPKNLHPFSNWSDVASWINSCSVSLATTEFGKYETLSPDMAIKLEERKRKGSDIPEFWVHLRDQVFWQPLNPALFSEDIKLASHFQQRHQVTSKDFKFYLDAIMNPYVQEAGAVAMRNYLEDIEEIEIIDDLTFIVRWKAHFITETDGRKIPKIKYAAKLLTGDLRPLASFIYKYFPDGKKIIEDDIHPDTYRKNSVWAQNFSQHWARGIIPSCGPWIFAGMSDRQISFKRNRDYYFLYGSLIEGEEIAFKDNPDSIWEAFKAGHLDSYNLRPEQLVEWKNFSQSENYMRQAAERDAIKSLDYLVKSYSYIGWNEARPFFSSKNVRRAMTMAIDRQTIIHHILNGMGVEITGPFFLKSNAYDPSITPWPFDPEKAKQILGEEGWFDSDNDGVLDKKIDGKTVSFRFSLTYYAKNPTTQAICSYIATALKEIGVDCHLRGVDIADLSSIFDDKNFDAISLGWTFGSPPDNPRQIWHSAGAKEKGSSNAIGFANIEVDKLIEDLEFESNQEKRIHLYHQLHAIIHEEAPYTFLYTPKTTFLYREYLQNVFIPAERQDLIPGANVEEPQPSIFWIKKEDV